MGLVCSRAQLDSRSIGVRALRRILPTSGTKILQYTISFIAIAVAALTYGCNAVKDVRAPRITLSRGAGELDPHADYRFQPSQGEVIVIQAETVMRVRPFVQESVNRTLTVFYPGSAFGVSAYEYTSLRYETMPQQQKAQKVAGRD